jgi:hypothetical protein
MASKSSCVGISCAFAICLEQVQLPRPAIHAGKEHGLSGVFRFAAAPRSRARVRVAEGELTAIIFLNGTEADSPSQSPVGPAEPASLLGQIVGHRRQWIEAAWQRVTGRWFCPFHSATPSSQRISSAASRAVIARRIALGSSAVWSAIGEIAKARRAAQGVVQLVQRSPGRVRLAMEQRGSDIRELWPVGP